MRRGSFDQVLMPLPSVCQPSGHCPLLLRAFKPAVCQPSNFQTPKTLKCSAEASTRHSCHCPLLLRAFKPAVCQPSGHCPRLLSAFKPVVCQPLRPLPSVARGVQACRLPALKPLKPLKCSAAASTRYSCHCPLFASRKATALCCC